MPASLSLSNLDMMEPNSNRTEQLALQLALLQGNFDNPGHHHHHHHQGHGTPSFSASDLNLGNGSGSMLLNGSTIGGGSLEDLKGRRSQNMTECVPVPSSEHVAEIVGRQGCKIKALRAKTNTYIKTPVRGEEPVFVVTGRKEDVAAAKREILSAADHFSQIRASRKNNINSTLALGQMMANTPGQTTVQVQVPYRVVGLVVGPKGATIKRIQQQTHTYIVTPSRDKDPVFEVTGLPENVDAARKEIEAHIALRTGQTSGGPLDSNYYGDDDSLYRMGDGGSSNEFSSSSLDHIGNGNEKFSSILNGLDSPYSSLTSNNHPPPHRSGGSSNGVPAGITLRNLLDSNNYDMGINGGGGGPNSSMVPWSIGDSHDSGIGNSPPFDSLSNGIGNGLNLHNNHDHDSHHISSLNGIWGDLSRALGGLDLSGNKHISEKPFLNVGSRSSLDLGTLGRPLISGWGSRSGTPSSNSANSSSLIMNTANNHHNNLGGGGVGSNGHHYRNGGALDSLPSSRSSTTTEPSPPNSLPFNLQEQPSCVLDQMVCHALDNKDSSLEPVNSNNEIPENVAFCSDPTSDDKAPMSCAGDFLSFAN